MVAAGCHGAPCSPVPGPPTGLLPPLHHSIWGSRTDPKDQGLLTRLPQVLMPWAGDVTGHHRDPRDPQRPVPVRRLGSGSSGQTGRLSSSLPFGGFPPVSPQVSQHYLELGGVVGTGPCLMGRGRNKMRIVQQVDAHLCLFHYLESGTCLPVLLSVCPTRIWTRGSTTGPAVTSPLQDNLHRRAPPLQTLCICPPALAARAFLGV